MSDPTTPDPSGSPHGAAPEMTALARVATLALRAAAAHREGARALEDASVALGKQALRLQEQLAEIHKAREEADAAARAERQAAREASLEGLVQLSQTRGASSPVATQFQEGSLAATKKMAKDRGQWKIGDRFDLVPEPTNPHDPEAMAVTRAGAVVGYVARDTLAKIKELTQKEGWVMAGPAFLASKSGGKWDEGRIHIRLANPIMGWAGYNPALGVDRNLAAMEAEALAEAALAPAGPRKRAPSI